MLAGSPVDWLSDAANASVIGAWSFAIGTLGTVATLIGLWFTFKQAKLAARAARTTASELDALKDRIARHDAAKEVSQAIYAISIARSQVTGGQWEEVSRRCEDAAQALMRVNLGLLLSMNDVSVKVSQTRARLGRTVDDIDAARGQKGEFPEEGKLLHALRRHIETLSEGLMDLQKEAAK